MPNKYYFGVFDFDDVLLSIDYRRVCKELGISLDGFSDQKNIKKEPIKFIKYIAPFLKGKRVDVVTKKIAEHTQYIKEGWELLTGFYENGGNFIIVTNNPLADFILKEKGHEELNSKVYKTTELKVENDIFMGEVIKKGQKIDYLMNCLNGNEKILIVTDNNTKEERKLSDLLEELGYMVEVIVI